VAPIHKWIPADARDGILKRFEKTLLETGLAVLVERCGFIRLLKRFGVKPVRLHEYFF
jgi:hypothetical protein